MKRKKFALAVLSGVCLSAMTMMAMTMTAFASDVYISLVPEDEIYSMEAGGTAAGMEPVIQDGYGEISSYSVSNNDPDPGKSYTYTIQLRTDSGDEFVSGTEVSVYGAYEMSVTSSNSRRMTIKAKTYPFHVLDAVTGITIDEDSKKATWEKVPYAKGYSVKIYYEDKNGNVKSTKKSTTTNSISLSSYIGKYENVDVSVKATKGTSTSDRFIAETQYVFSSGGIDDSEDVDRYDFKIPTATRHGTSYDDDGSYNPPNPGGYNPYSGGPGGSGNVPLPPSTGNFGGPGNTGSMPAAGYTGWQGSGNNWYYMIGGVRATGWVEPSANEWYLLNSSGLMLAGWQYVGGMYYYMNTNHDGSYGRMLVGYQNIGGKTYYLNEQHDGTYGAMYANRYTPNGRYAGPDGTVY